MNLKTNQCIQLQSHTITCSLRVYILVLMREHLPFRVKFIRIRPILWQMMDDIQWYNYTASLWNGHIPESYCLAAVPHSTVVCVCVCIDIEKHLKWVKTTVTRKTPQQVQWNCSSLKTYIYMITTYNGTGV